MSDSRITLCEVRGLFADLNEKLCGEEGSSVWLPAFKKFLRKENPWEKVRSPTPHRSFEVYPTPFIPGLTWKERIERCKFDWVDPRIWKKIERFVSINSEGENAIDIALDHFEESITSDGVELSQAESGFEVISPARFLHLCEFHPDLQRKCPIVCTQAICVDLTGEDRVLYVNERPGERRLFLGRRDSKWHRGCGFPCTPKIS